MLDARTGDPDIVHFLEGIVAYQGGGDLPGEDHHGYGIHIGRGDAGNRIGGAGPRSHQHHAGPAGGAGIPVRRMGRPLLVAHQDMLDVLLPEQCIIDVQYRPTGVTEHILDTFILQALNDNLGSGQFHKDFLYKTKKPAKTGRFSIGAKNSQRR